MKKQIQIDGRTVTIHPDAKYVLRFKESVPECMIDDLHELVSAWWEKKGDPVLIVYDGLELVRVDEVERFEELTNTKKGARK